MNDTITTEKVNRGLVKTLIDLIKRCDGETIRHILDESGQMDYIFESRLRDEEILRENVGCLDNVVELVQRINFVKEEANSIEKWASDNCIDIQGTPNHEYPLSRYLGNLSEIVDLDSDNVGNWTTGYKVYHEPDRVILMGDVVQVSPLEWVIDGENYDSKKECANFLAHNNVQHENDMFNRVWVTIKGDSKPLECNVTSFSYDDIMKIK
jgi:hypothetical protein